ncbi:hypothetical protein ADM99_09800 [Leptolinea tardivitalis]|uniref:Glycosyltransferase RgtA/B/C/D-like domain-containing protein n=2 Tax=Leptolinea tardivitalis TaxID=229920 RepID=A0A0P6XQK3_9CHLR|nr:hypothetical protein ADM99_09800 [Leptolinea tardivitalis]GAP20097.1 hypothetical protein LTAR_00282 [Leptolinea tardivitalis]
MVVLVLAGLYSLSVLARNDWNPMTFVVIGKQFDPSHGITTMGYDGQFAYQIAVNPAGAAPYLDIPAYRYQRIGYPILSRWLSLGNPGVIPWMMIFINMTSLTLGTLATEWLLTEHNHNRWFALVYGLFAGQLLSLRLDLTEPMAFMLVQWGVLFFDRKRLGWSGFFFALAGLTRELTLLFPAACTLSLLFHNKKWKGAGWGLAVLAPFAAWQIFLFNWLGNWGVNSGGERASSFEWIPFHGWWGYHTPETQIFFLFSIFVLLVALIPATVGIITAIKNLWQRQCTAGVWILLANSLIFPFLPTSNVLNPPGLVRMVIGLVAAVLDYGALEGSLNALRFSLLWLFLLAFGEGLVAIY